MSFENPFVATGIFVAFTALMGGLLGKYRFAARDRYRFVLAQVLFPPALLAGVARGFWAHGFLMGLVVVAAQFAAVSLARRLLMSADEKGRENASVDGRLSGAIRQAEAARDEKLAAALRRVEKFFKFF